MSRLLADLLRILWPTYDVHLADLLHALADLLRVLWPTYYMHLADLLHALADLLRVLWPTYCMHLGNQNRGSGRPRNHLSHIADSAHANTCSLRVTCIVADLLHRLRQTATRLAPGCHQLE